MARAPLAVIGVPTAQDKMGRWGEILLQNFGRELVKKADEVVRRAKRDVPVLTGALQRTIRRTGGARLTGTEKTIVVNIRAGGTDPGSGRQVNYAAKQEASHRTKAGFIRRNVLEVMAQYPGTMKRTVLSTKVI